LLAFGRACGLDLVVEVHEKDELSLALDSGADILGVNSRDLSTFTIDRPHAWALLRSIPAQCIAIAESGMSCLADVEAAAAAGADAVLVGSALSAAKDPRELVRQFVSVERRDR
ncbi:MAG: indole-3-glycerol-phosphate synthase TrpC, partial [Gemmatimonadota bacterium]